VYLSVYLAPQNSFTMKFPFRSLLLFPFHPRMPSHQGNSIDWLSLSEHVSLSFFTPSPPLLLYCTLFFWTAKLIRGFLPAFLNCLFPFFLFAF